YPAIQQMLRIAPSLEASGLIESDARFGKWMGSRLKEILLKCDIKIDLVGSHGHTVFHKPEQGYTYQIGHGAHIYAAINRPVVTDFRSLDVALMGQGAPLVPVGDELLFEKYNACLNLGGIANISIKADKRLAWDLAPCNILLNEVVEKNYPGKKYDEGGNIAATGQVDEKLMERLNDWDYYARVGPKTLHKDQIMAELWPIIELSQVSAPDLLATLCQHIGKKIGEAAPNEGSMLVTGGGALNLVVMKEILANTSCSIHVPDGGIVAFKEALIFAFLGLLRVLGHTNTLHSVTGASADSIGGSLFGIWPSTVV
ncbi:MAG: anhydro-N-acetylmuramic acid kinase, partial [Bacteroidota bacterium]|nr:anhydro-N-acetylmuramic acid kinase [Bacteroidota bacterium]